MSSAYCNINGKYVISITIASNDFLLKINK